VGNDVSNTFQAMADLLPRITAIMTAMALNDLREVTVADTGVELSPERMCRLFKAFASIKQDGMRQGRSICKTIVGAHGEPGETDPLAGGGTAFHSTFMRSVSHAR
jgi:signal transduction histidine kinase